MRLSWNTSSRKGLTLVGRLLKKCGLRREWMPKVSASRIDELREIRDQRMWWPIIEPTTSNIGADWMLRFDQQRGIYAGDVVLRCGIWSVGERLANWKLTWYQKPFVHNAHGSTFIPESWSLNLIPKLNAFCLLGFIPGLLFLDWLVQVVWFRRAGEIKVLVDSVPHACCFLMIWWTRRTGLILKFPESLCNMSCKARIYRTHIESNWVNICGILLSQWLKVESVMEMWCLNENVGSIWLNGASLVLNIIDVELTRIHI